MYQLLWTTLPFHLPSICSWLSRHFSHTFTCKHSRSNLRMHRRFFFSFPATFSTVNILWPSRLHQRLKLNGQKHSCAPTRIQPERIWPWHQLVPGFILRPSWQVKWLWQPRRLPQPLQGCCHPLHRKIHGGKQIQCEEQNSTLKYKNAPFLYIYI